MSLNVSRPKKLRLDMVQIFFNITGDNAVCIIDNCNRQLAAKQNYNLKRHIINCHSNVAIENKWLNLKENVESHSIHLDREGIIKHLVQLVTNDGCPLAILEYESFKYLMSPMLNTLKLKINSHNIHHYILHAVCKLRENIKNEVKSRIICLKFDTATRFNRPVLGVNVQFLQGPLIKIRT